MSCIPQPPIVVPIVSCFDTLTVSAGFEADTLYYWIIKTSRGHIYQKPVTSNPEGEIVINKSDLPPGLFNAFSGVFELSIRTGADYLTPVKLNLIGREFDSIFFNCVQTSGAVQENKMISTEVIESLFNNLLNPLP